ncbi:mucin [Diaporthe eres]|uniref:GDS1 winged helix domain-containing protein n=1 Tax=Diaporthe vaccinii TaxID=105482 RepID=A0ABR4E475_9PEZI|nr:mucin [Diaporthe eres]
MPYNTRRKSLSLPSLGIHVPVTLAERDAARAAAAASRLSPSQSHSHSASSASSSMTNSPSFHPPRSPSTPADMDAQTHASKKIKRSHAGDDTPAAKRHQPAANKLPPSPPRSRASSVEMKVAADPASPSTKIDLSTVNDEIVEAVIVQLQNAGNRPHIVKELVPVLMQQLKIVQQSANPSAIISSRLSTYLKRSCWNANNPCPMAKELETVHPRRTYFYLTTCPHGPLPEPTMAALAAAHARTLVTPSATSASEDAEDDRRRELSPSPEVDLSSPEFDDVDDDMPMPATPVGSFSGRQIPTLALPVQTQRGASPPLEKDEKEFTQTADGLQKRKLSGELLPVKSELVVQSTELDEHAKDDSLFGEPKAGAAASHPPPMAFMASPAMRPAFSISTKKEGEMDGWAKLDSLLEWDRSPETIELDELDCLLNDY